MTNKDFKELGLPLYEDIVRAFQETDHYSICHRTSEEWTDGAEWMRNIAYNACVKIATEQKAIDEANPSDAVIMRILNAIGYEEESWIPIVRKNLETREE